MKTAVPPQIWSQLQQKQKQVTLHNLAIYRELNLLNQALQAEEIPVVVLKGAFLATAVYPHIGQRAVGDLDLLVPQDRIMQTVGLLHELGWHETKNFSLKAVYQHQHHLPQFAKNGVNFPVEIHWNVVRPRETYTIPPIALWQQTEMATLAGTEVAVFPAHVQLLHLALHAAYQHRFAFDLRSLCDIAMLVSKQQGKIDWPALVDKAIAWKWQRGVCLVLTLVQDFWPETAVPAQVLSQLKPAYMPDNLLELAKQQLLWGRGNNKEVSPNFALLKSSKTVIEKIKFIFYFILPPRSRLAWQYGIPLKSPMIWLYYPINLGKLLTRNARRTWHLLRGTRRVTEAATRRSQLTEWLAQTE